VLLRRLDCGNTGRPWSSNLSRIASRQLLRLPSRVSGLTAEARGGGGLTIPKEVVPCKEAENPSVAGSPRISLPGNVAPATKGKSRSRQTTMCQRTQPWARRRPSRKRYASWGWTRHTPTWYSSPKSNLAWTCKSSSSFRGAKARRRPAGVSGHSLFKTLSIDAERPIAFPHRRSHGLLMIAGVNRSVPMPGIDCTVQELPYLGCLFTSARSVCFLRGQNDNPAIQPTDAKKANKIAARGFETSRHK
jgi:hypothetical protein